MCDSELLVPLHGTYETARIVHEAIVPGIVVLTVISLCWLVAYAVIYSLLPVRRSTPLSKLIPTIACTSALLYYLCACLVLRDMNTIANEQEVQYVQRTCTVQQIGVSHYHESRWALKPFAPDHQIDLQVSTNKCLTKLSLAHERSDYIAELVASGDLDILAKKCNISCWVSGESPPIVKLYVPITHWAVGITLATLFALPLLVGALLAVCFGCSLISSYVRRLMGSRSHKLDTEKYTQ